MKFALLAVLLTVLVATHSQAEKLDASVVAGALKDAGVDGSVVAKVAAAGQVDKAKNLADLQAQGKDFGASASDIGKLGDVAAKLGIARK